MKGPGGSSGVPELTEERPIGEEERSSIAAQIARLSVTAQVALAVKGDSDVRRMLVRHPTGIGARAVIGTPGRSEAGL